MVVEPTSARGFFYKATSYDVDADHINLVKPESKTSNSYKGLKELIQRMVCSCNNTRIVLFG